MKIRNWFVNEFFILIFTARNICPEKAQIRPELLEAAGWGFQSGISARRRWPLDQPPSDGVAEGGRLGGVCAQPPRVWGPRITHGQRTQVQRRTAG